MAKLATITHGAYKITAYKQPRNRDYGLRVERDGIEIYDFECHYSGDCYGWSEEDGSATDPAGTPIKWTSAAWRDWLWNDLDEIMEQIGEW